MNISTISIPIALTVWYILIGIYNLVYLWVTKEIPNLNWKKFIIETLSLLALYFVLTSLSFMVAGGSNLGTFYFTNIAFIFAGVLPFSIFFMKLETKKALIYSTIFTALFNLYWYSLFGVL